MKEIKHTDLGHLKIETSYWQRVDEAGNVISGYIKNTVVNNKNEVVYEERKETAIRKTDSFLEKFLMQLSGKDLDGWISGGKVFGTGATTFRLPDSLSGQGQDEPR